MNLLLRFFSTCVFCIVGIAMFTSFIHAQNHRAVLLNGLQPWSEPGEPKIIDDEFWNDTYRLWEILYCNGVPDSNIYVLYYNGQDYSRPFTDTHYVASRYNLDCITDFQARYADVDSIFHWLAYGSTQYGIVPMTEKDNLFIYTFDHGIAPDPNGHVGIQLYLTPEIYDTTFARLADLITYNKRVVWMQQCYGGGFADDLSNNKTIFNAAAQTSEIANPIDNIPSWENEPNLLDPTSVDSFDHGEFNYHIMNAVWEQTPMGASVNADLNNNNMISFWEASEWERTQESTPETPVYTDLGNFGSSFSLANFAVLTVSTDSLALAYNGNRHMVRKPNTDQFHIVYANKQKIWYRYSSDAGSTWGVPLVLGKGKFPCIALNSPGYPCVVWTDDAGALWFRKYSGTSWSGIYLLYVPPVNHPRINSPPSMAITPSSAGDTVHVLITLGNGLKVPTKGVADYLFPLSNPNNGRFTYIETEGPERYNPCLARCAVNNSLHAVWQRADTVCYAVRNAGQQWNNWGDAFYPQGRQSAFPFVETYGDRVFAVWQHIEASGRSDIYRAWRYLAGNFQWQNLSQTGTQSLYGVNASGLTTTFIDEEQPPPPDGEYEVYWKRISDDPLNNISITSSVKSIYPQAALKYNQVADNELYVLWEEGNKLRYEMKFKKVYVPDTAPAYLSSLNGNPQPSSYVVRRDTFMSAWAVPADIANEQLRYRFPLEPGYMYQVKAVAYHELGGQFKSRLKIDNSLECQVQYSNVPETIAVWIPPALYADGLIEISFERVAGSVVGLGPIAVYQYESEIPAGPPGGPMAQSSFSTSVMTISAIPTVFTDRINLVVGAQGESSIDVDAYDIAGRLVKHIYDGVLSQQQTILWFGDDTHGRDLPKGIYFVMVKDCTTNNRSVEKVLKVK